MRCLMSSNCHLTIAARLIFFVLSLERSRLGHHSKLLMQSSSSRLARLRMSHASWAQRAFVRPWNQLERRSRLPEPVSRWHGIAQDRVEFLASQVLSFSDVPPDLPFESL